MLISLRGKRRGKIVDVLYKFIKRGFDLLFSLCAIIVLTPIIIIISLAIKLDDGGHVFFLHSRIGLKAKQIKIIKFRTMKQGIINPKQSLPTDLYSQFIKEYRLENDPRETKVGRRLRRCNLDEIPQFFNVLFGNLSLVGPIPITLDELTLYTKQEREMLLSIKPGLTGYWQTYGKGQTSYLDDSRQKMELYYVQNKSVILDIKIIIHTMKQIIKEVLHELFCKEE